MLRGKQGFEDDKIEKKGASTSSTGRINSKKRSNTQNDSRKQRQNISLLVKTLIVQLNPQGNYSIKRTHPEGTT